MSHQKILFDYISFFFLLKMDRKRTETTWASPQIEAHYHYIRPTHINLAPPSCFT
jgi:hypothetical protein